MSGRLCQLATSLRAFGASALADVSKEASPFCFPAGPRPARRSCPTYGIKYRFIMVAEPLVKLQPIAMFASRAVPVPVKPTLPKQ